MKQWNGFGYRDRKSEQIMTHWKIHSKRWKELVLFKHLPVLTVALKQATTLSIVKSTVPVETVA